MSNTAFTFLSDSYLTRDDKESFLRKTLTEIELELDNYRIFLNAHKNELEKECIGDNEDSVEISDFRILEELPKSEEVFQKSLFLNRFVIDDPLQSTSFKNFETINRDRQARGFAKITEIQAKEGLWNKVQYMKGLLPAINANVGYIKFYPLSKEPPNEFLNDINFPDLNFPNEFPEIYEWFLRKIIVKTVDDNNHIVDLMEPCGKLGISFQNDGSGIFFPAFLNLRLQNIVPSISTYKKWKEDEIIKSIRDRYLELLRKNEFRVRFGAIVSAESQFEFEFLNSIIKSPSTTTETKVLQVLTKLKLPSLASTSLDKVMEVRRFFDESFENFRKQLKDDIIYLQQAEDEKQLVKFSGELEKKYESMIKEIERKMKFKFNFSGLDFFPTGIDVATMLTTTEQYPLLFTGANILYKIYGSFVKNRSEAKSDQCYFLYKLK